MSDAGTAAAAPSGLIRDLENVPDVTEIMQLPTPSE